MIERGRRILLIFGMAIWAAITIIAIICAVIIAANGGILTEGDLLKSDSYDIEELKGNIIIRGGSFGTEIKTTNGDKVVVSQYGDSNADGKRIFDAEIIGDGLEIKVGSHIDIKSIHFWVNRRLVVEIPKTYAGRLAVDTSSGGIMVIDTIQLSEISLRSSSGRIRVDASVTAEQMEAVTKSGGVRISAPVTVSGGFDIQTSSGSVNISGELNTSEARIKTSSGGIKADTIKTQSYTVSATSGGINVEAVSGGGSISTHSGAIRVGLKEPEGEVSVSTSSGGIRINMPEELSFTFTGESSSGSIGGDYSMDKRSNGHYVTAGQGDSPVVHISAKTSSGGIKLLRACLKTVKTLKNGAFSVWLR